MNTTATALQEVIMRCREHITEETVNSVCLIESQYNVSDAMKKAKPNTTLTTFIRENHFKLPVRRVFMLQHSIFLHADLIPTTSVTMANDVPTRPTRISSPPTLPQSANFFRSFQHQNYYYHPVTSSSVLSFHTTDELPSP